MKRSQLLVAIYAVLIFGSGVLVGVVSHKAYQTSTTPPKPGPRSPEDYRKRYIDEMSSRLKLDDRQLAELNVILDAAREQWKRLRDRDRAEIKTIQEEQTAKIRAILNPAQQAEYSKMLEEREKRRDKGRKDR